MSLELSTGAGMEALMRKLGAIGRYSTTPYIVALYGSAELAQAFCRAAAVSGAIFMLCNSPSNVTLVEDASASTSTTAAAAAAADAAGACVTSPSESKLIRLDASCGETITTRAVICAPEALPAFESVIGPAGVVPLRAVVARAVCITRGRIRNDLNRVCVTIAPRTRPMNNPNPIFVLQCDSTTGAVPDGYCALYFATLCTLPRASTAYVTADVDNTAAVQEAIASLRAAVFHYTRPSETVPITQSPTGGPHGAGACVWW